MKVDYFNQDPSGLDQLRVKHSSETPNLTKSSKGADLILPSVHQKPRYQAYDVYSMDEIAELKQGLGSRQSGYRNDSEAMSRALG